MRLLTVLLVSAVCVAPVPALACSTCKCADQTITLFGTEKPFSGRFRIALDYYARSETTGSGVSEQTIDEERSTFGVAYSLSPDITLALLIPFVRKELETVTLARQEASGLGDIDFIARWVMRRSGGISGRHLAGLHGGVRLPTAEEVEDNGMRLDIDVQPDAGATAPNIGAWYSYFRFPWFVNLSATYFTFSEGNQDFQAGDAFLASALAQYGINEKVALQFGLDVRHSERNDFSGVTDPNSGGVLAMGFTGLALRVGEELLVSLGYQSPLIENLHGDQEEGDTFRIGLTYDL